MCLSDFDYNLPKELIAQYPASPRDHSRLLVFDKKNGRIEHKNFYNVIDYLNKGDIMVLNNSKVIPARLIGKKTETRGKIEVFLLKKMSKKSGYQPATEFLKGEIWQCLVGGKRKKENLKVEFDYGLEAEIIRNNQDGTWLVAFNKTGGVFMKIINRIGLVPLPPYIKREDGKEWPFAPDRRNYQTVYASDKELGSVAAPTAGLHFTPALLRKIKTKGVQIEYVTLHVGLGTFAPVKENNIAKHKMHAEWVEVKPGAIKRIRQAKSAGRRIIAVGTTSVRTLESFFSQFPNQKLRAPIFEFPVAYSFQTDIFIYPGYKFKIVDAMITNFHLPKSTLLMLVSAFAGRENILLAYEEAMKEKYRFFSYGDAMFIK